MQQKYNMRLYFVRHGESISNAGNYHAGNEVDTGLTERGMEQARKTGQYLLSLDPNITHIYCSTLLRAKETAKIIKKQMNLDIKIVHKKKLVEKGSGILSGTSKETSKSILNSPEFEEYHKLQKELDNMDIINRQLNFYRINELQSKYIKAEPYSAVRNRGTRAIKRIVKNKLPTDNLLIVAHGSLIHETIKGLTGTSELNFRYMLAETFNCYLVILEYANKKFKMLTAPTNFFLNPSGKFWLEATKK